MSPFPLTSTSLLDYSRYLSLLSGNDVFIPPIPSSFDLLSSVTLSSSSNLVEFTNLSQYYSEYKHLQLRTVTRNTGNVGTGALIVNFNGDGGNNYTYHAFRTYNAGSPTYEENTAYNAILAGWNPHGGTNPGNWGVGITDILEYGSSTKFKSTQTLTGVMSYANIVTKMYGLWKNQNAISTISIIAEGGNSFAAGSRYALYGVKS